jgi:hypothetical protein
MRLCFGLEEPAVVVLVLQEEGLQSTAHAGRAGVEEAEDKVETGIHQKPWVAFESRNVCENHITSESVGASRSRAQSWRVCKAPAKTILAALTSAGR